MRNIPAECLTFPLQMLDYAHEKIIDGLSIGEGHLQETWPVYYEIIERAMTEIHRLHDGSDENPS